MIIFLLVMMARIFCCYYLEYLDAVMFNFWTINNFKIFPYQKPRDMKYMSIVLKLVYACDQKCNTWISGALFCVMSLIARCISCCLEIVSISLQSLSKPCSVAVFSFASNSYFAHMHHVVQLYVFKSLFFF